jgi:hypothetical protein
MHICPADATFSLEKNFAVSSFRGTRYYAHCSCRESSTPSRPDFGTLVTALIVAAASKTPLYGTCSVPIPSFVKLATSISPSFTGISVYHWMGMSRTNISWTERPLSRTSPPTSIKRQTTAFEAALRPTTQAMTTCCFSLLF